MSVALLSGKRSKDPNTQVGACIVNKNNVIESIGYNGLPKGCSDDEFPWEKEGEMLNTKYPFVVHAELNAILNAKGKDLSGSKMMFKCAGVELRQLVPSYKEINLSLNIDDV